MINEIKRKTRGIVDKVYKKFNVIFLPIIILICVMAILIGIYVEFYYVDVNDKTSNSEEKAIFQDNFDDLFNNEILESDKNVVYISNIADESKNVVYTAYDIERNDGVLYDINVKVPKINIDAPVFEEINSEIKDIYYNKAYSIMRKTEGNTIYSVKYEAFIYSNVFSLIIKSSIKENEKNEKVSIRTYVYDLNTYESLSIEKLIEINGAKTEKIQKTINEEIQKKCESSLAIAEEYGNVFQRDINSDIYKIENTENYFMTNDGKIYIVYAYGNSTYTNEVDVLIF